MKSEVMRRVYEVIQISRYIIMVASVLILIRIAPVDAEIYQWTDKNGNEHFSDDLSKVPPEYRPNNRSSQEGNISNDGGAQPSIKDISSGENAYAPYSNSEVKKITDDYLMLYKTGKPEKAYEKYWNWESFCSKAFDKNYSSLQQSDRMKVQNMVLKIATGVFSIDDMRDEMRKTKFINQNLRADKNGNIEFSFEPIFRDGTSGGENILFLKKVNNKFWCVDIYNKSLLSSQLGSEYASVKDKLSLLSFLKMSLDDAQEDMKNASSQRWLHGTWELTYDPDNNDKDWIEFTKFGKTIIKGTSGPGYEGFYRVKNNKIILGFKVQHKYREIEMTISKDKSKLMNKSGAYYTKTSTR